MCDYPDDSFTSILDFYTDASTSQRITSQMRLGSSTRELTMYVDQEDQQIAFFNIDCNPGNWVARWTDAGIYTLELHKFLQPGDEPFFDYEETNLGLALSIGGEYYLSATQDGILAFVPIGTPRYTQGYLRFWTPSSNERVNLFVNETEHIHYCEDGRLGIQSGGDAASIRVYLGQRDTIYLFDDQGWIYRRARQDVNGNFSLEAVQYILPDDIYTFTWQDGQIGDGEGRYLTRSDPAVDACDAVFLSAQGEPLSFSITRPSPPAKQSKGLSTGAIIAIVLGSIIGAGLLAVLGYFLAIKAGSDAVGNLDSL